MKRFTNLQVKGKIAASLLTVVTAFSLTMGLSACSDTSAESDNSTTAATESTEQSQEETTVVYEGIFLDNDEVTKLFAEVRGKKAPYKIVPEDFHVTTQFMPETAHPEWYGQKVTVHITAYAKQKVKMDDGKASANEGFGVELSSDNQELSEFLKSLGKNYHITGSSKDAAKYTEQLDFSKGAAMDKTMTGTFGGYMSDSTFDLGDK